MVFKTIIFKEWRWSYREQRVPGAKRRFGRRQGLGLGLGPGKGGGVGMLGWAGSWLLPEGRAALRG